MRRLLPLILAAALTACATASNYTDPGAPRYVGGHPAAPEARPLLRIVTFNIAHAHHIAEAITCLVAPPLRDADIVLLEEMDAPGAEKIAAALQRAYVYYPGSKRGSEPDMGNAILSPWPIDDTRKLLLPRLGRFAHRQRPIASASPRPPP
jgi:endonuclease/exonuclease/phosphatase family metal-dependent hydrolase